MDTSETSVVRPGLRERKKQQTRETIERVALQLFAERGYERTTLAEIADAADVSKRTIFAYFDSKEDILFCDEPALFEGLKHALEQRPPGTTTVDALRDFLISANFLDENASLRKKIINADEGLRHSERARMAEFEQVIAQSIARDLDAGPDDIRPLLAAASLTAAVTAVRDRLEAEAGQPITYEQALPVLDQVLEFLRGGLEGLQRTQ